MAIDGRDVNFASPAEANAAGIACIFQELSLIPDLSVADNIVISNPPTRLGMIDRRAQRRIAEEALARAGAEDIHPLARVKDLPLSRRQIVEIAKALVRKPRILILDEATSSVDIGTERKIERALRRLLADRTAFIIAHRLSTIRDADEIIVLEEGAVVERGRHADLLVQDGRYAQLVSHGDEVGRTQRGNNNVYCQDSELSWMDWSLAEKNADLVEFTSKTVALRKKHPVFRRRRFFEGKPIRTGDQVRDIAWLTPAGEEMTPEDWGRALDKCVAVFLNGKAIPEPDARGEPVVDDSFLLCFNAHGKTIDFVTPAGDYANEWTAVLDTSNPVGDTDLVISADEKITVQPRSVLVLKKSA